MAYLFPAELRAAGMALTYNVSAAIFGGASLYFVTLLIGSFPYTACSGLLCANGFRFNIPCSAYWPQSHWPVPRVSRGGTKNP